MGMLGALVSEEAVTGSSMGDKDGDGLSCVGLGVVSKGLGEGVVGVGVLGR